MRIAGNITRKCLEGNKTRSTIYFCCKYRWLTPSISSFSCLCSQIKLTNQRAQLTRLKCRSEHAHCLINRVDDKGKKKQALRNGNVKTKAYYALKYSNIQPSSHTLTSPHTVTDRVQHTHRQDPKHSETVLENHIESHTTTQRNISNLWYKEIPSYHIRQH